MDALDKSLLKAIRKGDRRAQLKLYDSCFSLLMGVAIRYRLDPDKSAELINDTFIKALKKLDHYQVGTSFRAWIKTIMIHTVIDDFRKQQRNREMAATDEQLEYGGKQVAYNDYIRDERIREILKVLEVLPRLPAMCSTCLRWRDTPTKRLPNC
ncbi:RNA polymerase sigma factor [bacterium SCSIO 12741]|nr:RNA polymerase sigma factor [bacterium SCSIO 12741]